MNHRRFHGIASLVLILLVSLASLAVISWKARGWGIVYLGVLVTAPQLLLRAFCTKCPCQAHCGHVFPGRAAMAFAREPRPYTPLEIITLVVTAALVFGMPQPWLWQMPFLFAAYWIVTGIALAQIRLAMCPACTNVFCPLKKELS